MVSSYHTGTFSGADNSIERRTLPFDPSDDLIRLMTNKDDLNTLMTADLFDETGQQTVVDLLYEYKLVKEDYNLQPSKLDRGWKAFNDFKEKVDDGCIIEGLVVEGQHRAIALFAALHKSVAEEGLEMSTRERTDPKYLSTQTLLRFGNNVGSDYVSNIDNERNYIEEAEQRAIKKEVCQSNAETKVHLMFATEPLESNISAETKLERTYLEQSKRYSVGMHESSEEGVGGALTAVMNALPEERNKEGMAANGGGLIEISEGDSDRVVRYSASSNSTATEDSLLQSEIVQQFIKSPLENNKKLTTALKMVSHKKKGKKAQQNTYAFPPRVTKDNMAVTNRNQCYETKALFMMYFFPIYYKVLASKLNHEYNPKLAEHVLSTLMKATTSARVEFSNKERAALEKAIGFESSKERKHYPQLGTCGDTTSELVCGAILLTQLHLAAEVTDEMTAFKATIDEFDRLRESGYNNANIRFLLCK